MAWKPARRGVAAALTLGLVALASACITPPPTPSALLTVVVGGTVASPAAGGKVVLRNDAVVNSSQIPLTDLPASALGTSALDSLLESAPLRTASPQAAPLRTATIASLPLRTADAPQILLSSVALANGQTWDQLLAGTPLAGSPTQAVTLNQVAALAASGSAPALAALTLGDLDLTSSPLRTASVAALALGDVTLGDIPAQSPPESDPYTTSWCPWIQASGLDCTDFDTNSTVLDLDLHGAPLRTAPLRTAPLRTADLSTSPLRTAPLRTAFLDASPLRTAPLRTAVLGTTALSSIALSSLPLRTAGVDSSPLRTAPLRTANPEALARIVDCSRVDCTADSTQTLGDAAALEPSAILPGATVGDFFSVFPDSVTLAFVLGDLKSYGNATIGDIQAFLPDSITLADAIVALIPPKALAWESVPLDDLNLPLHGGTPAVAVTAKFALAAGRDAASSQLTVTLPPEAIYIPGNARLAKSGGGFTTGEGAIEPQVQGSVLTFVIPQEAPAGSYSLGFTLTATHTLSSRIAFTATAVRVGSPLTASATIPVVSVDPAHPSTAVTMGDGDLYLGVLSSTSGPMTFNVPVPSVAGSVTQVTISHLTQDFDLVGYKPTTAASLTSRTFRSNGLKTPPIASTDPELGGFTTAPDTQVLSDLGLTGDPSTVATYSANRGTADEKVQLVSRPGDAGTYKFQVTGYNGAASDLPFLVTVRQNSPAGTGACAPGSSVSPAASSTGTITASTKTVFLVDSQRMTDVYGADAYAAMRTKLDAVAARPEVAGSVITVDGDPAVRSAYSALNAQPCDAAAANGVVQSIDGLVDRLLAPVPGTNPWRNLTSEVIVGSDQQIPMARVADGTASSNEADYAPSTQQVDADGNAVGPSPLSSAEAARMMLTDDAYGSWNPISWRDSALFLPDVALGRLVEKPSEIDAALDAYLGNATGRLDASSALVSGYDFMADGAQAVDDSLSTHIASPQTLISDDWTKTELLSDLYPAGASPEVDSINAHFSHDALLPALGNSSGDQSTLVTTADVATNPGRLQGHLIFSMGCHSGLSVPDGYLTGLPTTPDAAESPTPLPGETAAQTAARLARLDWAEAFANDGAVYIGNTGYGYGDSSAVSFSERLMVELAKRLDGSVSAGQALEYAKQAYYGSLATFSDYDQKSLMETVFYGLPFWGVGPPTTAPVVPPTVTPTADSATGGVQSAAVSITPAFTSSSTGAGAVVTADGKPPTVVDQQAIIPRTSIDVTPTSASLEVHGYLITSLVSNDQTNFQVAFGHATVDSSSSELPATPPGTAFPATLQNTNIQTDAGGKRQYVNLNVGQFTGSSSSQGVGTLREFTRIGGQALYSAATNTDGIAPTIATASATDTGTSVRFDVAASDRKPGTSPGTTVAGQTVRAVVMYQDDGVWHLADLTSVSHTGGLDQWSGTVPVSGGEFNWFAQVVDAAGNVSVTTNKAALFAVTPTGDEAPTIDDIGGQSISAGAYDLSGGFEDFDGSGPFTAQIDLGQGSGFQPIAAIEGEGDFWEATGSTFLSGTFGAAVRVCDSQGACSTSHFPLLVHPPAVQVAAGRSHTCALLADGSVSCWGRNSFGELGDGSVTSSNTPVQALPPGSATAMTAGWDHSCAVMASGTVECWGFNVDGQIGDGTTTNRSTPTVVPGLTGVTDISAGGYHTCALLADTTVRCWGENDFGEVGDGSGVERDSPVVVPGLTDVRSISAGRNTTCANVNTGGLFCWGSNGSGQLGLGDTTDRLAPEQLGGLYDAVGAGGDHTCEIAVGGDVDCQGDNAHGQLGFDTPLSTPLPSQAQAISEQDDTAAGNDFTCAQSADEVRCWGDNSRGQLGNYFLGGGSSVPSGVFGVSASQNTISAGYQHACAVDHGDVLCWGADDQGQLGDGVIADNAAPERVRWLPLTTS